MYNGHNNVNTYLGYDHLFLIELNDNENYFSYSYNVCDNIESKKLEKAVSISIDKHNVTLRKKNSEEFLSEYPNSIIDILLAGTRKTYSLKSVDFEVTLSYQDDNKAQFIINGWTSKFLKEGERDTLPDGSVIMINHILGSGKSGNSVQFYLGKK